MALKLGQRLSRLGNDRRLLSSQLPNPLLRSGPGLVQKGEDNAKKREAPAASRAVIGVNCMATRAEIAGEVTPSGSMENRIETRSHTAGTLSPNALRVLEARYLRHDEQRRVVDPIKRPYHG